MSPYTTPRLPRVSAQNPGLARVSPSPWSSIPVAPAAIIVFAIGLDSLPPAFFLAECAGKGVCASCRMGRLLRDLVITIHARDRVFDGQAMTELGAKVRGFIALKRPSARIDRRQAQKGRQHQRTHDQGKYVLAERRYPAGCDPFRP